MTDANEADKVAEAKASKRWPMKAKRNGAPLQVYNGQKLIGEVEDRGRRNVLAFKFEGADRVVIGVFPTRIEAMRAVAKPTETVCQD